MFDAAPLADFVYRTRTRRRRAMAAIAALALYLLSTGAARAADVCDTLSADAIVQRIMSAQGVSAGTVRFTQQIRLRAALFTWDFSSDVVRTGDKLQVTLHHAPFFLPDGFTSTIADPNAVLADFAVSKTGSERLPDGTESCVLHGTRKANASGGADWGDVWVDTERWLIRKIRAHYFWGTPELEFVYGVVDQHTVVVSQHASLTGFDLRIDYSHYAFDAAGSSAQASAGTPASTKNR